LKPDNLLVSIDIIATMADTDISMMWSWDLFVCGNQWKDQVS